MTTNFIRRFINSTSAFFSSSNLFSIYFWGSILTAIPLVGAAISNGFQMQTIKNLQNGFSVPLLDWDNWKKYFADGIWIVLAIYVVYIPLALLAALSFVADLVYGYAFWISLTGQVVDYTQVSTSDIQFPIWIAGGVLILLNLVCGLAVSFIFTSVPAMVRRVTETNSFWVALDFPGHFMFGMRNLKHYSITWLVVFVLMLIATPIATFISGLFVWLPILTGIVFWAVYAAIRFTGRLIWASQLGQMNAFEYGSVRTIKTRGFIFLCSILIGTFVLIITVGGIAFGSVYFNQKLKEQINFITKSENPINRSSEQNQSMNKAIASSNKITEPASISNVNTKSYNSNSANTFAPANNSNNSNMNTSNSGSKIIFEPELLSSRLYESDGENLPLNERIYGTIFYRNQTRYANIELNLNYNSSPFKRRIPYRILWYNEENNSVISEVNDYIDVSADQVNSYFSFGYGSKTYGSFDIGYYRIKILIDDEFIAEKSFEVR